MNKEIENLIKKSTLRDVEIKTGQNGVKAGKVKKIIDGQAVVLILENMFM